MASKSKKRLWEITGNLLKIREKLIDPYYIYDVFSNIDEKAIDKAVSLIDEAIVKLEHVKAL
jgi:hypothetical protein